MTGWNPWVVLGVTEDAPYCEVQSAFRRKAKQTHPDGGGDAGDFETLVRAFAAVRNATSPQPRPARPTPYDPWLRSSGSTVSLTDIERPGTSRRATGGWPMPTARPAGADFASVLLTEISVQRASMSGSSR